MAFSLVSTHAKAGAAGACGRPQAALCLQSRIGKDCISLQLGLANSPSASAPSRTGVVAAAKGFAAGPPPDAAKPLPEEDIEVAQEVLSDCKVAFTVTLPVSMVQEAWNRTLRDLRSNSPMDGFRSGAAVPESLLLARCGGRRKVNGACIENILQTTYPMVLQRGLQGRWLSDSEKVESKFDDMLDAFALDKPFTYKISAEVMPDMQWTQPYTGLQATVRNLVPAENDEAEVAKLVLSVRKQHGTMRVVADRGLQLGDVAVVDFTTRRTDLDEDIQGLAQKRFRLDTDDADAFPPGVVEQMVGQKLGEEKSYSFTFPADWEPEALRNVDCTFTVQVLELFEFELAEMDDELAERIRPSSGGVEPLLRELRQGVASARQQQNDARRINTVTELIRDRCSIEVPECLVRDFGYQQYQDSLVNAFEKGSMTYSAMKEMATEQLAENYINSKRAELTEKYRIVLAFDDIYKREGLSIDEERVEAEFVATRAQFTQGDANGVEEKDLDEERLREQIVDQMKRMAVLDFLIANGDVQEVYA